LIKNTQHPEVPGSEGGTAMSFWSEWSEGKKWVMGITASLTTALLINVINRALPTANDHGPRQGKPKIVAQHLGSKDPVLENFVSGRDLAPPDQQSQWDRINYGSSLDGRSWKVVNPVVGAVPYRFYLSPEVVNQAMADGWRITMKARISKIMDPDGLVFTVFDTGSRRYDFDVTSAYPSDRTKTDLKARLNLHVLHAHAATGFVTDAFANENKEHLYSVTYYPQSKLAVVSVDEIEKLRVTYEGHTDFTQDRPMFLFGTSGAEAELQRVSFEVF